MSEFILVKFSSFAAMKYNCGDYIVMKRQHYERIIAYVNQKMKAGAVEFIFGSLEFCLEDDIRYLTNELDIIPITQSEAKILKLSSGHAKFGTSKVNNILIK